MSDKINDILPLRPGEKPVKKEIKGIPFAIYLNGNLIEISKQEALGLVSQIINILCYLDIKETENE